MPAILSRARVAMLALPLLACGSVVGAGPDPAITPQGPACALAAGPERIRDTVSIAVREFPDPADAPAPRSDAELLVVRHFYETLVRIDCAGRMLPGLAATWSGSDDGRRWTLTLRDGARFWDGTPVTAPDVLASWAMADTASAPWTGPAATAVSATNERTIEVRFTAPWLSVALFTAYTGERPENPWGHYMVGLSSWKGGDRELAERAFLDALAIDSSHVKSRLNLGRVLLETERPREALEHIDVAVGLEPGSSDGYRLRARAFEALGWVEDAIASYKTAIVTDGEDVWALNNLGLILIQQGRFREALGPLARVTQLEKGKGVASFFNNLGIALERTGHYAAAADAYRAALGVDETYGKASVNLARVVERTNDPAAGVIDLSAIADSFVSEVERWR